MGEIVSWFVIEKGWRVIASDGAELGRVDAVTGDSDSDIFDGLAVDESVFEGPHYVSADKVGEITEGWVKLLIGSDEFERLAHFEKPAESLEIEPETAPRSARITESFRNLFRDFRRR
jgi:hypothetical protein